MIIQGQVGPIASTSSIASGTQSTARLGNMGELIFSELHGRYYETTYRRNMFSAYSAAQTLSISGTAMTGLILWNGSSTVNLAIQKITLAVVVTSATMTGIGLGRSIGQPSTPTTTTAITSSGNNFIGGASPLATAYNAGTIVNAPTIIMPLCHNTAAIASTGVDQLVIDLEGSVIVPPQSLIALVALGAASAASGVTSSIMWEEVPI